MAELNVSSQTLGGTVAVTRLTGELDAGNFGMLEDEFNQLLESGVRGVILDLFGLISAASSGIGAIVYMARVLKSRQGLLVVSNAPPKIQGLLEMLGLGEALTIVDTPEQARKLLSSIK